MTFDDAVDIAKGVVKYSQQNGIDQDWILALFDVENHFHATPTDGRGSHGIPQLQVDVAQAVADELKLQIVVTSRLLEENSELAIQLACRNFKDELKTYGGDYLKATRSYNFGDKRVKRNRICGLKYFNDVFQTYWTLEKYKASK